MQTITSDQLNVIPGGLAPVAIVLGGAIVSALLQQPNPQTHYSPFQAQLAYDAYSQPVYMAPMQGPYGQPRMQLVGQQAQGWGQPQPMAYYPAYY